MNKQFFYPCSLQFYDICDHFDKHETIIWRKTSDIKKGDIVYIYISKPINEIRYKCIIVNDSVDASMIEMNNYAIPKGKISSKCQYIQLKLQIRFSPKLITLAELKEVGVRQFMVPMHLPPEAYALFVKKEKLTINHGYGGDTDAD